MDDLIEEEINTVSPMPPVLDGELEEMMKAGIHLGHARGKNNPSMKAFIFGVRNNVSVIDLTKTQEGLQKALEFIKKVTARSGLVLLVGTRPAARKIIKEVAEKTRMPYLTERWIGGSLTNFKVISKRVEYMESLEKEKVAGGFEKYTKKERMQKGEEIIKLQKMFDGLRLMKKLPEAVFIVNVVEDDTAVREARRMKIPIVALVDTNSNCLGIDWLIPSNDDALPAVRYMVGKMGQAIEEGHKSEQEAKRLMFNDN